MALDKPYLDIPGTTIFDAEQSRRGYHLNQFCMSLMKPENRQRVAEGLYHGIETYLQSTNSLANNQVHIAPGNRSGIVARSANSQ